jgi:hypothetical protein
MYGEIIEDNFTALVGIIRFADKKTPWGFRPRGFSI